MIRIRNWFGYRCESLGNLLIELSRRLVACPDCRRSRFYSEPCV